MFLHHSFQRKTRFVTAGDGTGGKNESEKLLLLIVYPATKMRIAVLTFDVIILARAEISSS